MRLFYPHVHQVPLPEILYDISTIYQYDRCSKAHIAYFLKPLRAPVLSYNSSVSCKSEMSLVCEMIEKEAEYKSRVIKGWERNENNVKTGQE